MIKQYKEIAERVGGKQDAIERLDLILEGLRGVMQAESETK